MNHSYLNLLGLAYRARKISTGEELILKDIQKRNAKLILIANDVSEQTKRKLTNECKTYDVQYIEVDDRYKLGGAIRKQTRVGIAVIYDGFGKKLKSLPL